MIKKSSLCQAECSPHDLVHVIDVTVGAEADGDPFARSSAIGAMPPPTSQLDSGIWLTRSSCANDVEFRIGHLHALASEK